MRWSFIQRLRRTVSAPKYKTKGESCSSRSAPLVLGQLQRPGIERTRVAGWQSQTVACGGGNGEAGVGMFRVRTSVFHRNRRRRGNERKGGSLQLRKGGVHIETDRAVALLGFAFSTGSQAARRATPAIPRSQVACGASTGEITAIWAFLGCFLPEIAKAFAISAKAWRNGM